jgi:hypothetical protein
LGGYLVLKCDHRQIGGFGDQPEMFADEVDGDIGLLQAALDDRHQLAGHEGQRLLGQDFVPQLGQLATQLIALRLQVGGGGGQKDGLGIRGPLVVGWRTFAQVFEHLRNIVGDVVHSFVEALDRDVAERLVELAHAARGRVALEKLVGHQARVQRTNFRRDLIGIHGRLDDVQQPRAVADFETP